jgi:hypothetical protein
VKIQNTKACKNNDQGSSFGEISYHYPKTVFIFFAFHCFYNVCNLESALLACTRFFRRKTSISQKRIEILFLNGAWSPSHPFPFNQFSIFLSWASWNVYLCICMYLDKKAYDNYRLQFTLEVILIYSFLNLDGVMFILVANTYM